MSGDDNELVRNFEEMQRKDRERFEEWDEKADTELLNKIMEAVRGIEVGVVTATLLNVLVESHVGTMLSYQPMRDDEQARTSMAGSVGRYLTLKILGVYDDAIEEEEAEKARGPKQ